MGTSGSTLTRTCHQISTSTDYFVELAYTNIAESVTAGQAIKNDPGEPDLQQRHRFLLAKNPVSQYEDSACDFSR